MSTMLGTELVNVRRGFGKVRNGACRDVVIEGVCSDVSEDEESDFEITASMLEQIDIQVEQGESNSSFTPEMEVKSPERPSADQKVFFEDLPHEVTRRILGCLPIMDLHVVVNRVSHQLHTIISATDFLPFKKLYFRYRYTQQEAVAQVSRILDEHKMSYCKEYYVALVECVHREIRFCPLPCQLQELQSRLESHRLFGPISEWMDRWIWPRIKQKPSIWAYLAAVLLLCESASETAELLQLLLALPSLNASSDIYECAYMVALLLLAGHRQKFVKITPRIHYNVITALHFLENDHPVAAGSFGSKSLTAEQLRIINHKLKPDDCVRIIAFAGTGKTTTLIQYVKARPDLKFLVLMFNKAAAEQARDRFPPNATPCTTNSLGWSRWPCYPNMKDIRYGKDGRIEREQDTPLLTLYTVFKDKLDSMGYTMKPEKVKDVIGHHKGFNTYALAKIVIESLKNYFCSDKAKITSEHVPDAFETEDGKPDKFLSEAEKRQVVELSNKYWHQMRDPDNGAVKITHDGYMKIFQLEYRDPSSDNNRPRVPDEIFDVILMDEAQDLNPVTYDVLKRIKAPMMFVGDPHQQIYAFRGAVDALELVPSTQTFYLTQSFRFGPEIAFIANTWLETVKKVKGNMLIGTKKSCFLDGRVTDDKRMCIITRINATQFTEAVKISQMDPPKKLYFLGGEKTIKKFDPQDLKQLYSLYCKTAQLPSGQQVPPLTKKFYQGFNCLSNLQKYAKKIADTDLQNQIALVQRYKHEIPGHVDRIKSATVGNEHDADFLLTTAHGVKGLEFDNVMLAPDFIVPTTDRMIRMTNALKNELNLIYVAMTRAKCSLIINNSIREMLTAGVKDPLDSVVTMQSALRRCRPVPEGGAGEDSVENMKCSECQQTLAKNPQDLVLLRPKTACTFPRYVDGNAAEGVLTEMAPGVFCSRCSTRFAPISYTILESGTGKVFMTKETYGMDRYAVDSGKADFTRLSFSAFLRESSEYTQSDGNDAPHSHDF